MEVGAQMQRAKMIKTSKQLETYFINITIQGRSTVFIYIMSLNLKFVVCSYHYRKKLEVQFMNLMVQFTVATIYNHVILLIS